MSYDPMKDDLKEHLRGLAVRWTALRAGYARLSPQARWGGKFALILMVMAVAWAVSAEQPTMTGVFVNGRELYPQQVMALQQLLPITAGRYWCDVYGNFGSEGGPLCVNLNQLASASPFSNRQSKSQKPYFQETNGGNIGSDGQSVYYFDRDAGRIGRR